MVEAKLVGTKIASTFTGFCGFHDNQTFEPVEKQPFQCTQECCFLLAYRIMCKELFLKKADQEHSNQLLRNMDRGRNMYHQLVVQQMAGYRSLGIDAGLRELDFHKGEYDRVVLSKDYSAVHYYVIWLTSTPDFLCAGGLQPEYDFQGNILQDLSNVEVILDHITYSIIATPTAGAVVFSWLGDNPSAQNLIRSLDRISDDQLPHAILRFTFEYFENVFTNPIWWESLDEKERTKLMKRQLSGLTPDAERLPKCLCDDGLRLVLWKIIKRESNIQL